MPITRDQAWASLKQVNEPELHKDIVTLNVVKDLQVDAEGRAVVTIVPAGRNSESTGLLERDIIATLKAAGAVEVKVSIVAPAAGVKKNLPQVKHVIAVGAGKGGVGKSTIAVNIAVGLQRTGAAVGLMDGDIYGPSMPTLLGIKGAVPQVVQNKIIPFHVHGIHAITIGALVEPDKPLIWRGPMSHGAFKQLLLDNTEWPELDYLVVDLPPGTGDIPLSLCQLLGVTGAVIVATPQQVALDDAIRAVRMFEQLQTPILGMVENMAGDIFGRGGTESAAQQLELPFLGRLELFPDLRINSDAGTPHANYETSPQLARSLEGIVRELIEQVRLRDQKLGPTLEIF